MKRVMLDGQHIMVTDQCAELFFNDEIIKQEEEEYADYYKPQRGGAGRAENASETEESPETV